MPAFFAIATMLFAHGRSSCREMRFGIAAAEADQNGTSTTADRNANASRGAGACASPMQKKNTAPRTSETIITVRRSYRSPSVPAKSPTNPVMPNVNRSVAESHAAECVRWKIENISAV